MKNVTVLLFLFAAGSTAANAQSFTLQQAIDTALAQNLQLKAAQLNTGYYRQLSRASTDFSTTAVTTQYGQMNSVNNDTWIGVTQNFSLPQVYRTQREHWKQQAGVSASEEVVRKNELKLQVKELYYGLLITAEKKQWLLQADSLYAEFVKRARQRLQAGETNVLELNTALNHQTQLRNQMLLLQQEYERLQQELQLLLNSTVPVVPVAGAVVYSFQLTTADAAAHPLLQWREQQLALAKQQVQLERTKLSPAFSIGYNNISLIGFQKIGTNEVYFGGSRRFSSALLGMNIPLFSKPVQTKIKAAGIQVQQQQVLRDAMQQQLLLRRKQAVNEYLKLQEVVANYNGLFTGSNEQMIKAANLQLQKGEINFLEWTLLINNLYQLRLQYLDAVRMLNSAAFVIESL